METRYSNFSLAYARLGIRKSILKGLHDFCNCKALDYIELGLPLCHKKMFYVHIPKPLLVKPQKITVFF